MNYLSSSNHILSSWLVYGKYQCALLNLSKWRENYKFDGVNGCEKFLNLFLISFYSLCTSLVRLKWILMPKYFDPDFALQWAEREEKKISIFAISCGFLNILIMIIHFNSKFLMTDSIVFPHLKCRFRLICHF